MAGRTARTEVVAALTAVALLAPETVAFALIADGLARIRHGVEKRGGS